MRLITRDCLIDMGLGAAVLGTGGGGDPYIGRLMAERAIDTHGPVPMLDAEELNDDDLVVPSAMMGAPTVMLEKLPNGKEIVHAFKALESYLGRKITATMSAEAGGLNSMMPFLVAAEMGIPIVDCDMMGRAYPELQMVTPTLYGVTSTPMAIADDKGNSAIINTVTNKWTETFARTLTVDMGCSAMIALYPMSGKQVKETVVRGTISDIERIGAKLRKARREHTDPIEAVRSATNGFVIFEGKIADVSRRTETGFARGDATLDGVGRNEGQRLTVSFQNEFLIARTEDDVLAVTPDLISILDSETGTPITTEALRYGFRVVVLAMPCDPRWRTPAGLELVGPDYFGYDATFVPVEERFG